MNIKDVAILKAVKTETDKIAAVKAKTDNLPSDPADESLIEAAITTAHSTTNGLVTTVDTVVDAVKAKTDLIPADIATQLDTNIPAIKAKTDIIGASVALEAGGNVAAIKAKTDIIGASVALEGGGNLASVKAKTDLIPADIVTQLDTNIPAIKARSDMVRDATYQIAAADVPTQLTSGGWTDAGGVAYTKVKESTLSHVGSASTLRVKFTIFASAGTVTTWGRIYKNGVALGTERSVTSTAGSGAEATFTEDLAFGANDLLQLYAKNSVGAGAGNTRGLWVYGIATVVSYVGTLD